MATNVFIVHSSTDIDYFSVLKIRLDSWHGIVITRKTMSSIRIGTNVDQKKSKIAAPALH